MRANRRHVGCAPQRGSALLISLMVMVGLSLLGLGFVAISETENQISVNERNYAQTLSIAEAGARTVVEWFQNPDWALSQGLMPANSDTVYPTGIKRQRIITSPTYNGVYRPTSSGKPLFDRPFFPQNPDRFWGTENTPDIQIDATSAATFLQAFNNALLPNLEGGEITEIKIYAPPVVNGTINANGFYDGVGMIRYGIATIKVTARKFNTATPREVIAERSVKIVISPWPFPGPQGPIQSNANIQTGGNFGVHWGKMTSQGTMEVKLPLVSLPWFNPYDRVWFEYGYPAGPHPPASLDPANGLQRGYNWFAEVVNRAYEDPWYEARARQGITNAVIGTLGMTTNPKPFVVDATTDNIVDTPIAGWSNWFQLQAFDSYPDYKQVIFPKIDYDFWKEIAIQASTSGQEGVYYLWPTAATGESYTDGSQTKIFGQWVNTARATNPARPGFYFFDTVNRLNPQGPGAPGQLADDVEVNSSDDGSTFQMQGFIYLNAQLYGTMGIGGVASSSRYNAPGEPYRDIGYQYVDPATGLVDATKPEWEANDGAWSCEEELDGDTICDMAYDTFTVQRPSAPATNITIVAPKPWYPGCPAIGTDCSEPHEPYLNIIYDTDAKSGGGPQPLTIGWQATPSRLPKARKPDGTLPTCTVAAEQIYCTSNGYDRDGAFVTDLDPILDGVFYNEGDYDTEGNAVYFGSLLINGNVIGTGTPEVWFDEKLIKGDWPPKSMPIPRVYISSHQTDQ